MDKVYLVWVGEYSYSDTYVEYISFDKEKADNIAMILDGWVEEMSLNEFRNSNERNSHRFTFYLEKSKGFNQSDFNEGYSYANFGSCLKINEISIVEKQDIIEVAIYIVGSDKIDVEKSFKIACDKLVKVKNKLSEIGIGECVKLSEEGFEF